jgi:hypothetical protein
VIGRSELQRFSAFSDRAAWLRGFRGSLLAGAVLVAVVAGPNRRRNLLLALPVFVSLPLFCLVQQSGSRFVMYIDESLILVGLPALVNPKFWSAAARRWRTVGAICLCLALCFAYFPPLRDEIIGRRQLLLWSPLLKPGNSTLYRIKSP